MILVTGTKRSGTSMWMQILRAAGFSVFGEAFPRNWGETIREANVEGFFESTLREGIYWRTNPHPKTGAYFFPEQVERYVVKVFIPGVVRSDRAYIGSIVATMRQPREYEASLLRLYALEDQARRKGAPDAEPPVRMPPLLEWWAENYALLRDAVIRRHRIHVQSYDGLLRDPVGVVGDTLAWLGGECNVEAAVAAVRPEHRSQRRDETPMSTIGARDLTPQIEDAFEALYRAVDERSGLTEPLLRTLNEANTVLAPKIQQAQQAVAGTARRPGSASVAKTPMPSW